MRKWCWRDVEVDKLELHVLNFVFIIPIMSDST